MKLLYILTSTLLILGAGTARAEQSAVHDHNHAEAAHQHDHDAAADETGAAAAPLAQDIEVSVYGLVCDFCAQAIEKVFMKQEAVEAVRVDLDNFLVTIDLKEGQAIDDATVTKLIEDAGYTVNEIRRNDG